MVYCNLFKIHAGARGCGVVPMDQNKMRVLYVPVQQDSGWGVLVEMRKEMGVRNMAALARLERQRYADVFLRTMDPGKAGEAIGREDGAALLGSREIQTELKRQRAAWSGQVCQSDVTRRMLEIAFGEANDCVRLAMEEHCNVEDLDLTLLSEIRRTDKGMVEVKLVDRMAALAYLAEAATEHTDPAAQFLAALQTPDTL